MSRPAALACFLALACVLAGCSPVYVFKSWSGHRKLMAARRPIPEVLSDPAAPEEVKAKLRLVDEVRSFAVDTMGLPATKNYRDFVPVGRPWVTVAVTASEKTALKAYQWWFPFVGRVPYKGHFERDAAVREAAALRKKGFDTYLMEVSGYSTLGWWADPLLSTLIDGPPHRAAETLLHELAHGAVYFKGQADFNEAAATYLGEAGAAEFVRRRFGPESPEARAMAVDRERRRAFDRDLDALHGELAALYASAAPEAEKLSRREEVFSRHRAKLGVREDPERPLNNAFVLAHRRYSADLDDFRRAHAALGGDWRRLLALLRSLDRRRPREALQESLRSPQ